MSTIGYRFMPLFGCSDSNNRRGRWTDRNRKWGEAWKSTVEGASLLEPRWGHGKLLWLYARYDPKKRWLIEFFDNGEPDFQLKQAATAARWVEEHRKK